MWDEHDSPAAYSEPAHFDTGLRTREDWRNAAWIAWRPDAEWRKAWDARKAKELAPPVDPNDGWIYPKSYPRQADFTIFRMWRFHQHPYDPAPLLRKTSFSTGRFAARGPTSAPSGYYELHLNGQRVGNRLLDPADGPRPSCLLRDLRRYRSTAKGREHRRHHVGTRT